MPKNANNNNISQPNNNFNDPINYNSEIPNNSLPIQQQYQPMSYMNNQQQPYINGAIPNNDPLGFFNTLPNNGNSYNQQYNQNLNQPILNNTPQRLFNTPGKHLDNNYNNQVNAQHSTLQDNQNNNPMNLQNQGNNNLINGNRVDGQDSNYNNVGNQLNPITFAPNSKKPF